MIKIEKAKNDKFLKQLFYLRNQKYIREQSTKKNKINFKTHEKWFKNFIKKNELNLILDKKRLNLIGFINIQYKTKNWVSWGSNKKYWGKLKFFKILEKKTNKKNTKYFAKIRRKNFRSLITALKAKFLLYKINNKFVYLKKN